MTPSMVESMADRARNFDSRLASDLDDVVDTMRKLYAVADAARAYVESVDEDRVEEFDALENALDAMVLPGGDT